MKVRMVVGVNVVFNPPGDHLRKGLLPALCQVPPGSREQIAIVLIPKVGKHGNLKAKVRMLL